MMYCRSGRRGANCFKKLGFVVDDGTGREGGGVKTRVMEESAI